MTALERAIKIEGFKKLWYARNPVHETNADTGEDMFWGTALLVCEEFAKLNNEQEVQASVASKAEPNY